MATAKKKTANTKKTNKGAAKPTTQVQWGSLRFRVDGKIVRGVDGFQASIKAKDDNSKCLKQFTEAEEIKFSILTSLETGGNPIKDYNYLKSFINADDQGETKACRLKVQEPYMTTERHIEEHRVLVTAPYHDSRREYYRTILSYKDVSVMDCKLTNWKGGKFKLSSVSMSDVQMDGKGRIHAARIDLAFVEVPEYLGTPDPVTGQNDFDGSWRQVKTYRQQSLVNNTW